MFRILFQLNYPVDETEAESLARYTTICELSEDLVGVLQVPSLRCCNLEEAWRKLVFFWECHPDAWNNTNLVHEALYYICLRKFSDNVNTPILMELVSRLATELQEFSLAFKVLVHTKMFQNAYLAITAPLHKNKILKKRCNSELYLYLVNRLAKLVMLKNEDFLDSPASSGERDFSCPYFIWKTYHIVETYEAAIKQLIPEAINWTEEWSDRSILVAHIKNLYGVDFSGDTKSLDALINAVRYKDDIERCAWFLYKTKMCSLALLHCLWGDNYVEKLQCAFLSLYKRYRAAKRNKTARGRYSQTVFMNHWIYKQIDAWRHSEVIELNDKVRSKFFNISLGI